VKKIVDLQGPEGNAFFLLGLARILAEAMELKQPDGPAIQHEMLNGDYTHLLKVFKRYFSEHVEFRNEPTTADNGTQRLPSGRVFRLS